MRFTPTRRSITHLARALAIAAPLYTLMPVAAAATTSSINTDPVAARQALQAVTHTPYFRPTEYAKMVTLPLRFIDTSLGKQLAVRVSLPADAKGKPLPGPFPTIVVQAAYNANLMSVTGAKLSGGILLGVPDPFVVKRGYAQVTIDALGTGVSEGGWELLGENEQQAFGEGIDWVLKQSWCNGTLGAAGASYMAISSLFGAEQRPDAIKAIFASVPMGDPYRGTVSTGGVLNGIFMSTWMTLTQKLSTQNLLLALTNPRDMSRIMRINEEHVTQIDRYYLPLANRALAGDPEITFDGPFWRTRSPIANINKIKAPTMIFGALDDIFQRDEPLLYEALRANNIDSRLVIYRGNHVTNFMQGFVGTDQVPVMHYVMMQWFDRYLRGMNTGTEKIPAVVQHVKNYPTPSTPPAYRNDTYATATDWPHPLARAERWFLHGDMQLTRTAPVNDEPPHTLDTPPAAGIDIGKTKGGGFLKFNVTLNDGTRCSEKYNQWSLGIPGLTAPKSCYTNNAMIESQHLNYETAPMEGDYYINGPIQADVWIKSTVTDAVISVRVDEVSANGKTVTPLSHGMLLASSRAVDTTRSRFMNGEMIQPYHYFTADTSTPLEPGVPVKLQVEVFPTSAVIRKGNRLRVSIAPSNQAQGVLNIPRQAATSGGITTILNTPDYPSSVVLPAVPASALN